MTHLIVAKQRQTTFSVRPEEITSPFASNPVFPQPIDMDTPLLTAELPKVDQQTVAQTARLVTTNPTDCLNGGKQSVLSKIADAYFAPKKIEKNGTLYKALGVGYFKKALMGSIGKAFGKMKEKYQRNTAYHIAGNKLEDLQNFERNTRKFEAAHIAAVILTNLPHIAESLIAGKPPLMIVGVVMVMNVYCIMLQRMNRERIVRVMNRVKEAEVI